MSLVYKNITTEEYNRLLLELHRLIGAARASINQPSDYNREWLSLAVSDAEAMVEPLDWRLPPRLKTEVHHDA